MGKHQKALFIAALLLLLGVLGYGVYQLLDTQAVYREEAELHRRLEVYAPSEALLPPLEEPSALGKSAGGLPQAGRTLRNVENDSIQRLIQDHPNALGWVSVPGTNISYPLVQGPDNDYFLRRDLDGNELYAGVPFLDCRCDRELESPNSIIYGHNLRNGTMFGALEDFKEEAFFSAHRVFYVYLPDRTICARIAACLVVDPTEEPWLFQFQPQADHLDRVYALARQSEALPRSPSQRFITLSTCDYERSNGRTLILGVVDDGDESNLDG